MIRSSLVLAALLAASTASAQQPDPNGPRLSFESKELDFGVIMHGSKTSLKVSFSNTGKQELVFKQVKPSCGCTVAEYPRKLAPGAKGTMELTFDSADRPAGYQSYRVAIYTNDPTQRDKGNYCTLLSLRGEVKTLYRIAPHGAYFGEFVRGMKELEKIVTVTGTRQADKTFTAELTESPPSYVKVELLPLLPNDKRKGLRVRVRLLPHAPLGQLDIPLVFKTDVKEQPLFRIPAVGLVSSRITGPPAVHFGTVRRSEGAMRMIVLERRDKVDGLEVAHLQYDEARLKVIHKSISARRVECEVNVRVNAPPGPFATTLNVYLDDANQRLVQVPIYGLIEPLVSVDPPTALLPRGTKPGAKVATFRVRLPKGSSVKAVSILGGELSSKHTPKDGAWIVDVFCKTGELTKSATLVVNTDVRGEERVEVPLLRR